LPRWSDLSFAIRGHHHGQAQQCREKERQNEAEALREGASQTSGELCHLQEWVKAKGLKVILVFEGRDRLTGGRG
jgi:polyphosphate kinase 2 (PPK2 family)